MQLDDSVWAASCGNACKYQSVHAIGRNDKQRRDSSSLLARYVKQYELNRGRQLVISETAEQRQHPRIATVVHGRPEVTPGHTLLLNVSTNGACLWLGEAPSVDQYLVLRFRCKGQDRVLRSRIVWSQPCEPTPNRNNLLVSKGWLAGISFDQTETDDRINAIPHDILHAGQATVSFDDYDDVPAEQQGSELTFLDARAIPALKSATNELVPILAKHFSEVRLICTRDRLELVAAFRPAAGKTAAPISQPRERGVEIRQGQTAAPPPSVELPSHMSAPRTAPKGNRPGREFVVSAGVAAAIVAAFYFAVLRDAGESLQEPGPIVAVQVSPPWAHDLRLDNEVRDGWVDVKEALNLPDNTLRSLILLMQDNERYPSGHDLHDLSKHPVQVRRALSLLATAQTESATKLDIGMVKDDLESFLMAGARFPDEPPGGRYSSLQRELYHNLVVLGVVDLFYRRQNEPPVSEVLAAVRNAGPQ